MDRSNALNIIRKQKVVSEPGIYKDIRVTNVSFKNRDGQPWTWENRSEEYAIVNFQLITDYQLKQAANAMLQGDFDKAVNFNASLRVTPEVGKEIASVGVANVEMDRITLKDGRIALLPVKARAAELKEAAASNINAVMEMLVEEQDETVKETVESVSDVNI
jgi:hypothetical protein